MGIPDLPYAAPAHGCLTPWLLERLLRAAERAHQRGAKPRGVPFDAPTHAYWRLTLDERDTFHAEMRQAEIAAAVTLKWSRHGGEDRTLVRMDLNDLDALARYLGANTYTSLLGRAVALFAPWREDLPALDAVLSAWRAQRKVRKRGAESASDFADAARVVVHMRNAASEEEPVRYVSRKLFDDTKRIRCTRSPDRRADR